jgi:hypothetical protein
MGVAWVMQAYAYVGIMESAANSISTKKSSALVGGAHLDLLAVTWLVQFGTVLFSQKFYWVLCIVPPWGGWTLYRTFSGGAGNSNTRPTASTTVDVDPAKADKRQKRAEKRQQKWS